MKISLIANFPLPYRVSLLNDVAKRIGPGFEAIFTDSFVPGHNWDIKDIHFKFKSLNPSGVGSRSWSVSFRLLHHLVRTNPDTIVIYGATLPMLTALVYAIVHGKRRVYFTDSWEYSYSKLSPLRKLIRSLIFHSFHKYIVIGSNGRRHLMNHGIPKEKVEMVRIPLPKCNQSRETKEKYDLIFAGRFISTKMPEFFLDVVERLNKEYPVKAVMAGTGPLEEEIKNRVTHNSLPVYLPGYLDRDELFKLFHSSKILLFPTENDVWGMSAQEALNCGIPVIATPYCGIVNDLLIHENNGYILSPDPELWVKKIKKLLTDKVLYNLFSQNACEAQSNITVSSESQKFFNAVTEPIRKFEA